MTGYAQVVGRAGRDGAISCCVLFYGHDDVNAMFAQCDRDTVAGKQQHEQLYLMQRSCLNNVMCRHAALNMHFGSANASAPCATCDVCVRALSTL